MIAEVSSDAEYPFEPQVTVPAGGDRGTAPPSTREAADARTKTLENMIEVG